MQIRAHGVDDLFIFGADDEASCSTALAWPGMALAGFSILPDDIARTSSVFQANSRSAGDNPSSPQSAASVGSSAVGSIFTSASAARTAFEIRGGLSASSFIRPLPSTRLAMALQRIVAGFASTPPQLPEWFPPSRKLTSR